MYCMFIIQVVPQKFVSSYIIPSICFFSTELNNEIHFKFSIFFIIMYWLSNKLHYLLLKCTSNCKLFH